MSHKRIETLVKKGLLQGTNLSSLSFYENCVFGKSHRLSFETEKHTTKGILNYIHSDLWGSINIPFSLSKCQYFISFIDNYSRKVWIHFLKSKDEAFEKFVEWRCFVENQTGKKIKTLRIDNDLEFCNQRFDSFCKK